MSPEDLKALWVSLKLATWTTIILMAFGTPLSWWLSRRHHWRHRILETILSLPLVLPPTVLGFYLLLILSPEGWIGTWITPWRGWVFTFEGLLIGSVIHSLPFAIQPMVSAFHSLDPQVLEAATTLGASPLDRFFTITLPLCRGSFLASSAMVFAHTMGEFGVVMMLGGSIEGETRTASIAIYEKVELLDYTGAHLISLSLVW